MSNFWDNIINIFRPSNKISSVHFNSLRGQIVHWNDSGNYQTYNLLPNAISFPSDFWQKVTEIHRHTSGDKHERAINVWWADGDVVVTHSVRGEASKVNIPKQSIKVSYKQVSATSQYAEKIVKVDANVYSKKTVPLRELKNKKRVVVQFLFNMHTHPPHTDSNSQDGRSGSWYSFFSETDIRSFLSSNASVTGLVTDKLWILIKTDLTPKVFPEISESDLSPDTLTTVFNFKVYSGDLGRMVIVHRPEISGSQADK
ncbi:hypothetical protein JW710_01845 [Candidatus Dojkabacteria bacterium]|nr:hypothetical protein [Candidatus Dojkabacteria bacterium]